MIKTIKHFHNIVKHFFRDVGTGTERSPHWETVRKHFLIKNPMCAACGTTEKLNVHHIMPFHLDKSLELDENNLITLCLTKEKECHLELGHLQNYKCYNPNVRIDAKNALENPEKFNEIVKMAFKNRLS